MINVSKGLSTFHSGFLLSIFHVVLPCQIQCLCQVVDSNCRQILFVVIVPRMRLRNSLQVRTIELSSPEEKIYTRIMYISALGTAS